MLFVRAPARAGRAFFDEITDKIIAEPEAGRVPWVQPWGTAAVKAPCHAEERIHPASTAGNGLLPFNGDGTARRTLGY